MPEQNLLSKYFCIIASQNCYMTAFPNSRQPHSLCFVCSHKSVIIYENYYFQWLLPLFFVIFSGSLSGSDNFVLFDMLDGNSAYSQMFYATF